MATAKWYTDFHSEALKPCWPTCLSSIIYLEALLRPMYFSLTVFHFYIFSQDFWTFTLFRPGISLFLHHSVLGSPCNPTANAKPNDSNPLLIALYIRCSGVQNITTKLAFQHKSGSFFIHCYTKTEIISTIQPALWQPACKNFSQWCCCTFKPSNISVQKQFPSLGFLTCIQCLGLLPLPRTRTQHLPTKVLG
jgi:hypothetical protein